MMDRYKAQHQRERREGVGVVVGVEEDGVASMKPGVVRCGVGDM
jgi:hypothetical protein